MSVGPCGRDALAGVSAAIAGPPRVPLGRAGAPSRRGTATTSLEQIRQMILQSDRESDWRDIVVGTYFLEVPLVDDDTFEWRHEMNASVARGCLAYDVRAEWLI